MGDLANEFQYAVNEQENTFARHFALSGKLEDAWLDAGYPDRGAPAKNRKGATSLLSQARIDERIVAFRQQIDTKLDIREERVTQELARIALFDIADIVDDNGEMLPLKQIPPHARACIKKYTIIETEFGIKTEVQFWDKIQGIDKIMKIKNMTAQRDQAKAPKIVLELGAGAIAPKIIPGKVVGNDDDNRSN